MRHKKRHLRKKTNNLLYKFKADTREATLTFNLNLSLFLRKRVKGQGQGKVFLTSLNGCLS